MDIPCPPCFLLAIKMNVTDGHIMRVFASHVHFYDSYPDGGTLGYPLPLLRDAPRGGEMCIRDRVRGVTVKVTGPISCVIMKNRSVQS